LRITAAALAVGEFLTTFQAAKAQAVRVGRSGGR